MKLLPKLSLILLLVLSPAITFATEAKVIEYKSSCQYLLVEGTKGYLLLKQQGTSAYTPKKKDLIDGFFIENFGISHLHKISSSEVLWVFNEFSWLPKDKATNKYIKFCGPLTK